MYSIRRTDVFDAWLFGLKDGMTHRRRLARLRKASLGNLGDVKPVGAGGFEMREHFGPGWRHVQRGQRADRDGGRRRQVHAGGPHRDSAGAGSLPRGVNHE